MKENEHLSKEMDDELSIAKEYFTESEENIKRLIKLITDIFGPEQKVKQIISELSIENWKQKRDAVVSTINEEFAELQSDEVLSQEYNKHNPEELIFRLSKLIASRDTLAASSTEERLLSVNVIACTLDGYIGRYTDVKLKVDHIFMDEAGYSNIIKALTLFNQDTPITFLGDHMQLPPVCELNDQAIGNDLALRNVFLWSQSAIYLEGLFKNTRDEMVTAYLKNYPLLVSNMKRSDLNETFRFGKNLAKILGRHVYDNGFGSLSQEGDTRIFYIHAPKHEEFKSRISINEVICIREVLAQINAEDEDYVILTPYTKQVRLLGQHLPQQRNELKILTVHGSQGREWDTVILSVVDTGDKWFVDSKQPLSKGLNLLNTALSRAKKRLIIVCDKSYWKYQKGQLVTDLIQEGNEIKVLV